MARVLVADDAAVARRILRTILTEAGHEVVSEAATGAEAIDAYRQLRPDLVMMDVTMPQVDGIEAARQIISEFPTARVVIVTSIQSEAMVRRSVEAGVAAYVLKPFTAARIAELTDDVLAS